MSCHVHPWCVLDEHDPPQQHLSRPYPLTPAADGVDLRVTRVAYADEGPVYLCLQVQQHEVDKDWTLLSAQDATELATLLLSLAQAAADARDMSESGENRPNRYPLPRSGTMPT